MQKTVARLLERKGEQVWTVAPDATVFEGLQLLSQHGIGALPVVEDGHLIGIISERDYARKVTLVDRAAETTLVRDIMTTHVHTVRRDTTTAGCMELMTSERIRHLPVVEDDALIGLVSIGDVVLAVIEEQRFLIEQLESYITS
jgi:CBS domain-containing protein